MRGNCVWRRAAALVLVVTVLCAGLAACGRGDEPAETTSGPEDQPGETVTVDVDITGQVFNMFLTQATARVGEEVVASAEMKIAVTQDTIKPQ